MTTPHRSELDELVDELTAVMPPPDRPMGLNNVVAATGRWKACRVGSGAYAIRAEYDTIDGGTVLAQMDNEITGFPNAVMTALRFTITLAAAGRHYWMPL